MGGGGTVLSQTMYSVNGFRKSTPTQNRQLFVLISNSEHDVDDFVGDLTFSN